MAAPRAAFVLGVTGNMDPIGYGDFPSPPADPAPAVGEIRDKVFAVLDWLREEGGCLDPATGRFTAADSGAPPTDVHGAPWASHGVGSLPIIVLSSLAPGIDTLVAEAALDYAAEHDAPVTVRAPLPFPIEHYPQASTFRSDHERARLAHLLDRIRDQEGFVESRDLFPVALHPSLDGDPVADLTAPTARGKRRYIRYRAAGEYVASYCDLLLAIYDAEHDGAPSAQRHEHDLQESGTAAVVDAKLHGFTHDLLPVQNAFDWADSGPVLHVPIERLKRTAPKATAADRAANTGGEACPAPLAFSHPTDCRPADCGDQCDLADPRWQACGEGIFRAIVADLAWLHHEPNRTKPAKEEAALFEMLGEHAEAASIAETAAPDFDLDTLARARRNVADINGDWDARVKGSTLAFFVLGILGVVALQAYENIQFAGGAQAKLPWFILTLSLLVIGATVHYLFKRQREEDRQLDSRVVAEGLKVQFYWLVSGIGESVASRILQRQRGELSWVRAAVSSVTFPHGRTVAWFGGLALGEKLALLRGVRAGWVKGQRRFFEGKLHAFEARKHSLHDLAYTLLLTGLILFLALLPIHTFHHTAPFAAHASDLAAAGAFLLCGLGIAWFGSDRGTHPGAVHFWRYFFPHRPRRPGAEAAAWWPIANRILVAAALALLALGSAFTWLPGCHMGCGVCNEPWQWLNLLKNFALAGGGLAHLWGARKFLAENIRRYGAMRALFDGAGEAMDRHLALIAREAATHPPAGAESDGARAAVAAAQELLVTVGVEALAENAEWLLMHRDRRVQPVMPGH